MFSYVGLPKFSKNTIQIQMILSWKLGASGGLMVAGGLANFFAPPNPPSTTTDPTSAHQPSRALGSSRHQATAMFFFSMWKKSARESHFWPFFRFFHGQKNNFTPTFWPIFQFFHAHFFFHGHFFHFFSFFFIFFTGRKFIFTGKKLIVFAGKFLISRDIFPIFFTCINLSFTGMIL